MNATVPTGDAERDDRPWYAEVTRYQWIVLAIASLGWVFDVFEGQIFVASMNEAMPSLLPEDVRQLPVEDHKGWIAYYNNITFGAFLLGGALGGVLFGVMSDRIGRKRTMTFTILMYSAFTCLSAFSQEWWHMAGFRFLVAMGVGGEWAVASTLVAEVFPKRARARSLGIFHASSVFGTYLAILAGVFIIGNQTFARAVHDLLKPVLGETMDPSLPWRLGFLVGVLPALLIIWIRRSLREPEHWEEVRTSAINDLTQKLGSFEELFEPRWRRNTLVGTGLAALGMATFWGVHIYGKDLMRADVLPYYLPTASPPAETTASAAATPLQSSKLRPGILVSEETRREHLEPLLRSAMEEIRDDEKHAAAAKSADWDALLQAARELTRERDIRAREFTVDDAASGSPAGFAVRLKLDQRLPTGDGEIRLPDPVVYRAESKEAAELAAAYFVTVRGELAGRIKNWEMLGMFLVTTGGGIGLLCFGPFSEWLGRRKAFLVYHLGGLAAALVAFQLLAGWQVWLVALPVFGFLTLGMHAGYAVYFPELFPTRLRGTGAGFCFNVGRILAAPILFLSGWMQRDWGFSLENAAALLSLLFLAGAVLLVFAPETRGRELPE
ncbi:MAG: MFS transporter [Planctomycetes bacterium]|nr:MFS transporter [Planctomycetota bacterium]